MTTPELETVAKVLRECKPTEPAEPYDMGLRREWRMIVHRLAKELAKDHGGDYFVAWFKAQCNFTNSD